MNYEYSENEKKHGDLYSLYKSLGGQEFLEIDGIALQTAMEKSFYVIYVYAGNKLIGTGRVISDGIINAYICGIGVDKDYRSRRIGSEILNRLVKKCKASKLHIQLICEEHLISYYESKGFSTFAVAMKKTKNTDKKND